jgi:uncharacterized delta-60 repeat protein
MDFALVRYNANGSLDNSFGTGGVVLTDFAGSSDQAKSMVVLPGGGILVGGWATVSGLPRFAVAKYTSAGILDSSFGASANGKISTSFSAGYARGESVAVLSDGSILLAGTAYTSATDNSDFAVVKYSESGVMDGGFGASGWARVDFGGDSETAHKLLIQPDGKLVLTGSYYDSNSGAADFATARLLAGGALDATFGSGGKVLTDFAGDFDEALSAAMQSDGKIVVVGIATTSAGMSMGVVRYTTSGALDNTLAGGSLTVAPTGESVANAVAIDASGNIVVAGFAVNSGGEYDFAAARIIGRVNVVPTANPGGPYSVNEGSSVQLNGAASSDPDGTIASYEWDFNYDGVSFAADATGATPTFNASSLSGPLTRTIALRVTDNDGATHLMTTTVTVNHVVLPPPPDPQPVPDPSGKSNKVEMFDDRNRSGMKVLYVYGTNHADYINLRTVCGRVEVRMNGKRMGKFANVSRIIVMGQDGNDLLDAHAVTVATELYGGNGNDLLIAGRGVDLLDGGAGKDVFKNQSKADQIVTDSDDAVRRLKLKKVFCIRRH